MSALTSIVLASGNAGKLREFDALFAPLGVKLIPQGALNIPDAPEPHPTFLENALAKARHVEVRAEGASIDALVLGWVHPQAGHEAACAAAVNAAVGGSLGG